MGEIVAAAVGHRETLQTALRFQLKLGRLLSPGGNHRVIRLSAVKLHSQFGTRWRKYLLRETSNTGFDNWLLNNVCPPHPPPARQHHRHQQRYIYSPTLKLYPGQFFQMQHNPFKPLRQS